MAYLIPNVVTSGSVPFGFAQGTLVGFAQGTLVGFAQGTLVGFAQGSICWLSVVEASHQK